MRKGTWVLLLLMTACLLGGCSKESAEQTEITLIHGWGSMESEHVRMRQIYKDFEKEHPEIKLNLMSMTSSDEVIKKTKNMLSVGEVPDLIFTGGYGKDSVYRFMEEKNKAADLMPYLEKDQEFADSVAPEIISYWQKDGKLYTLSDVLLLGGGYWYNADIFEKAGIPAARWQLATTEGSALSFAREVGYPIIVKPDSGVGASDTWKLQNEQQLHSFFAKIQHCGAARDMVR